VVAMDIEDYLKQKRSLEAKKELLESKEKLKDDSHKKKRELEDRKKKIESRDGGEPPRRSSGEEGSSPDMFKKILLWNTVMLLLIVGVIFAGVFFFMDDGGTLETDDEEEGEIIVEEEGEEEEAGNETEEEIIEEVNETEEEPTTYPGPEFEIYVEDEDLGPFESNGRIGGERLIINSKYYNDARLHLNNLEPNDIVCYVDREITVDTDLDGEDDLHDFDLDYLLIEFDKYEKFDWKESLPGAFEEGEYEGEGKVTVKYEARCYFCKDRECTYGGDKGGESIGTAKAIFTAEAGSSIITTNTTNSSS
jgi:hypothetical protein